MGMLCACVGVDVGVCESVCVFVRVCILQHERLTCLIS